VPIDVGTEDDALGIAPSRHENPHVAVDRDIDLLQFAPKDAEKGVLGSHYGGLTNESLEYLDKFGEIVSRAADGTCDKRRGS